MKIFQREPTLYIAVITSLIMFAGTLGFSLLSGEQSGLWVALVNGIAGAVTAWAVRPVSPVAFTYVVGAAIAVLGSYGLALTPDQVFAINALVVPVLALLSRGQVSPTDTAVSNA